MLQSFLLFSDFPVNYQTTFQDPGSQSMLAIIDLYDNIVFFLIIITIVTSWFLISSLRNPDYLPNLTHGNTIEIIWTILPAAILWCIGLPSLKLLYLLDELIDPQLTVKAIANQWYWSYELSDFSSSDSISSPSFDSFLIPDSDLEIGDLRTLTLDNYLILPINTSIRLLVTSNDVIHSFAVPSLGIKVDAIPGRLNMYGFVINRSSTFLGQCSELCGALHYGMPIGIKAVSLSQFLSYLVSQ
jgi:cytochrome c oxidase subunit 2